METFAEKAERERQMTENRERGRADIRKKAERIAGEIAREAAGPPRLSYREPTDREWQNMTVAERMEYPRRKAKRLPWPPPRREEFIPPSPAEIEGDLRAGRQPRRRPPNTISPNTPRGRYD